MTPYSLHINTIAYIVHTQPGSQLDCSAYQLYANFNSSTSTQTVRVRELQLIQQQGKANLTLQCTPYDETAHAGYLFILKHDQYTTSFCLQDENPEHNPLVQAIPTVPLFPINNPLGLSKAIPVNQTYSCSMEETHKLLQLSIPDLPQEVIQRYPLPIHIALTMQWPSNGDKPLYTKFYLLDNIGKVNAGLGLLTTPLTEYVLYGLRNTLVLLTILPSLRSMGGCWGYRDRTTLTPLPEDSFAASSLFENSPDSPPEGNFLVFPTLEPSELPSSPPDISTLKLSDYMPTDSYTLPTEAGPSPLQIANQIRHAFHQLQAQALQC